MSKKDGGPAFPQITDDPFVNVEVESGRVTIIGQGMSLRDWFASQFVASLKDPYASNAKVAESAYQFADAMLAEREK